MAKKPAPPSATRDPARLQRQVVAVELASGELFHGIRVTNGDELQYGLTAQKHGWPNMTVRNEVATIPHVDYRPTFLAWCAMKRLGMYAGTWEEFSKTDCLAVAVSVEDVDPTPPDPETAS